MAWRKNQGREAPWDALRRLTTNHHRSKYQEQNSVLPRSAPWRSPDDGPCFHSRLRDSMNRDSRPRRCALSEFHTIIQVRLCAQAIGHTHFFRLLELNTRRADDLTVLVKMFFYCITERCRRAGRRADSKLLKSGADFCVGQHLV